MKLFAGSGSNTAKDRHRRWHACFFGLSVAAASLLLFVSADVFSAVAASEQQEIETPEKTETVSSEETAGDTDPAGPNEEIPDGTDATKPTEPGETDTTRPTEPDETDATQPAEPDNTDATKPEVTRVEASVTRREQKKNAYISWEKADGAVSYEIQRRNGKSGKFQNIVSLDSSRRKVADRTVKRGNTYDYRVAAVRKDGSRIYSDVLNFACPLSQVTGVKLIRYSSSSVKVVWNKAAAAKCYKVYYASDKSGSYKRAGTTENNWYRVKKLETNRTYYFKVKACADEKASGLDGALSAASNMTTQPYERTTVFAGDSITTGLTGYNVLDQMQIGGNKNVVAAVGLNTITFRTRREFGGMSALAKVISYRPYRVYIMLGINELHYRRCSDILAGYEEIVKEIQAGTPDTDIVLLAASPVTRAKLQANSGFGQIPEYNQKLKKMATSMGIRYFDYTGFLKGSDGCLLNQYAAGDGFHWTAAAYQEFAKKIEAYDKSLDD